MLIEVQGDDLGEMLLVLRYSIQSFSTHLVVETEFLQDNRCLEAVGCALCVERNIGLDTHDGLILYLD